MDTRIHIEEEGFFALDDELFKEWHWSDCRINNTHFTSSRKLREIQKSQLQPRSDIQAEILKQSFPQS
jgi:hypothetical protein